MFSGRYFAARYFAPRYFARAVADVIVAGGITRYSVSIARRISGQLNIGRRLAGNPHIEAP